MIQATTEGWLFVLFFSAFLCGMGLFLGAREDKERRKKDSGETTGRSNC